MAEKKADDNAPAKEAERPRVQPPRGATIEEHAEELGIDAPTLAGVKMRERWPARRHVTKAQFQRAVDNFVNGPTVQKGGE